MEIKFPFPFFPLVKIFGMSLWNVNVMDSIKIKIYTRVDIHTDVNGTIMV